MSDKRYYLPERYADNPARPVYLQDLGSLLRVGGIILQGMGTSVVLLTPNGEPLDLTKTPVHQPSLAEWGEIIAQSDNPEIFVREAGQVEKILHRKNRFAISGVVQQRIWHRDNWTCLYCKKSLPQITLTVDHFVSLEMGGKNDCSNYISSCFKCNKKKGCLDPVEFCRRNHLDYNWFVNYLKTAPKIV